MAITLIMPFTTSTRYPGFRHMHVDGIKSSTALSAIIDLADHWIWASEILVVHSCLENPNRTDVLDDEGHHELNSPGDLISTTLIQPCFDRHGVANLVGLALGFRGASIELEHVIGHVDQRHAQWVDPAKVAPVDLNLRDFKYTSPHYDPVEYHLALDPLEGEPVPSVGDLMQGCAESDIMVGTWYNFGGRRLRSNRFAPLEGIRELVESDYGKFRGLCERKKYRGQTRVVAERVLGIWTSV